MTNPIRSHIMTSFKNLVFVWQMALRWVVRSERLLLRPLGMLSGGRCRVRQHARNKIASASVIFSKCMLDQKKATLALNICNIQLCRNYKLFTMC